MFRPWLLRLFLGLFMVVMFCPPVLGQWTTQTVALQPGWNAVFLEVQPEPDDCDTVFQDMPIESVWMWNRHFSTVQFIQDAATLMPEQPGWLKYFPDKAFTTNLYTVQGGRPYLVKLGGEDSLEWVVKGRPVIRPIDWMADSFNLVGFNVDPSTPPKFQTFFAFSPAHAGQPVHKLSPSGQWQSIIDPANEDIEHGHAYWVYSEGQSQFSGSLTITVEQGGEINFGRVLTEQTFRIKNQSSFLKQVTVTKLLSETPPDTSFPLLAGEVPLSYWNTSSLSWLNLSGSIQLSVQPGEELGLRIAVRRKDMVDSGAGGLYQNIFAIADGEGSRLLVPVVAKGLSSQTGQTQPSATQDFSANDVGTIHERAGLWIGTAVINKVSFPADPSPDQRSAPKPTASEFQMRLIVHVNSNGEANLLQQVILMWQEGTLMPDPEDPGKSIMAEPGRFVLVTDDNLMSQFSGASIRDGEPVGRRVSSTAVAFTEPQPMTGTFDGMLKCSWATDYDDPKNPFKHKYHPDHDNLDYDFTTVHPEGRESYSIERDVELSFTVEDPEGRYPPGWGDNQVGGTYRERIRGVHKSELSVEGMFRLHHVSRIAVLNDGL